MHDAEKLLNTLVRTPMEGAIIVTHIPLMILNYVDGDQEPRRHLQTPSLAPPEGDQPPHCNPPRLKTLSPKLSP